MAETVKVARTLTIEREFDAPRDMVWDAWTDPDQIALWWGPEGFTTPRETIEIDLRPGGTMRMTMVGPDGAEYPNTGTVREVDPPSRLVFFEDDIDMEVLDSQETIIDFIDLGGDRTKVVVTANMVCAEELIGMADAGWNSQLDKLVRLLAER